MNAKTSLFHRGDSKADAAKQLVVLQPAAANSAFKTSLKTSGVEKLIADQVNILQVNLGKLDAGCRGTTGFPGFGSTGYAPPPRTHISGLGNAVVFPRPKYTDRY